MTDNQGGDEHLVRCAYCRALRHRDDGAVGGASPALPHHEPRRDAATLYGHVLACDQRPPGEVVPEREMLGSILRSFDVSREQS